MSTKGGCAASCCAGNGPVQKVDDSKKKLNRQNIKRNLGGSLDLVILLILKILNYN